MSASARTNACGYVLVCACSNVCGEEKGWCMAMGRRGGGVAAEAAGRTPASLLAPGAPLLSK